MPLGDDFVDWYGKRCFARQLLFHGFYDVVRHEWFAVVLANMSMRLESGLTPQVACKLAALIVLDDQNMFAIV